MTAKASKPPHKKAILFFAILAIAILVGCAKKQEPAITGTWNYKDENNNMGASYTLKADGTGVYTISIGDSKIKYDLRYEVKGSHLITTYINSSTFSEDDVFDSTYKFADEKTLVIQDPFGKEMIFTKQY